ncbi:DUF3907 family protein [Rossellomorea aquimaris]|uniref:DUF3907 family protein n=1 Tax=Rossellomorea aquimaris TaxID=189382 RepID=UPI0005CB5DF7
MGLSYRKIRTEENFLQASCIRFRQKPPGCFASLLKSVEGEFHSMREELIEFEIEYRNQRLKSKE